MLSPRPLHVLLFRRRRCRHNRPHRLAFRPTTSTLPFAYDRPFVCCRRPPPTHPATATQVGPRGKQETQQPQQRPPPSSVPSAPRCAQTVLRRLRPIHLARLPSHHTLGWPASVHERRDRGTACSSCRPCFRMIAIAACALPLVVCSPSRVPVPAARGAVVQSVDRRDPYKK